MNHQEKKKIFNAYARYQGFNDWHALLTSCLESWFIVDEMNSHFLNACDLVQEQQQKRIAENQRKIFFKFYEDGNTATPVFITQANTSEQAYKKAYDHHGPQVESWLYQMMTDEEQILNPENKIQ